MHWVISAKNLRYHTALAHWMATESHLCLCPCSQTIFNCSQKANVPSPSRGTILRILSKKNLILASVLFFHPGICSHSTSAGSVSSFIRKVSLVFMASALYSWVAHPRAQPAEDRNMFLKTEYILSHTVLFPCHLYLKNMDSQCNTYIVLGAKHIWRWFKPHGGCTDTTPFCGRDFHISRFGCLGFLGPVPMDTEDDCTATCFPRKLQGQIPFFFF